MSPEPGLDELAARVLRLRGDDPQRRVIVGIAGAPGSGKSTLAMALAERLHAVRVPMDGFHLADIELRRLGALDRKGAPDTFDPGGYASLLHRLRQRTEDVWAPAFDREIEQPIAGSISIPTSADVIITEGNYLLLDTGPWARIRPLLDEVWFCALQEEIRLARLTARHEQFGKTPAAAFAWARGPDQRNAVLVEKTRHRADLVVEPD